MNTEAEFRAFFARRERSLAVFLLRVLDNPDLTAEQLPTNAVAARETLQEILQLTAPSVEDQPDPIDTIERFAALMTVWPRWPRLALEGR